MSPEYIVLIGVVCALVAFVIYQHKHGKSPAPAPAPTAEPVAPAPTATGGGTDVPVFHVGPIPIVLEPEPAKPVPTVTVAMTPPPPPDQKAAMQPLTGPDLRTMLTIVARGTVLTESEHELVDRLGASASTYFNMYGSGFNPVLLSWAASSDAELDKMAAKFSTPQEWAIRRGRNPATVPNTWADAWKAIGRA